MAFELGKPSTRILEMEATVFWLEAAETGDLHLMAAKKDTPSTKSCILIIDIYGELTLRRYVSNNLGLKVLPADGFCVKVKEDECGRATEDLLFDASRPTNAAVDTVERVIPRPFPEHTVRRGKKAGPVEEDLR